MLAERKATPDEFTKALLRNPRFKVPLLSGKGFIIGGQTPSKG